ncbi:MAG: HEAT repeat domain-containing protein [Polyangiaceae bacterium]|nr:HEAT repeat domain-containing protein [Polyangiaceae bacterium]
MARSLRLAAPLLWSVVACASPSPPNEPSTSTSTTPPPLMTSSGPSSASPATTSGPPSAGRSATFEALGAKLQARLTLDSATIMVSEPSYMTLEVTHLAGPPVLLHASWMGRNGLGRPENYDVQVSGPKGEPLALLESGPSFGGQSWFADVSPSKSFKVRLFLPSYVRFTGPGRHSYRLKTTWPVHLTKDSPATDVPVSVETSLEVVPDDSAKLGALIDAVAATASSKDDAADEALTKLLAFTDPRVVPQLVKLAASNDYTRRMQATRALGTWNDDRALEAIKKAAASKGTDFDPAQYASDALREQTAQLVRVTAAQALSQSPHPKAWDALLAMRSDPYPSVRLTVLQKAATLDPKIGGPIVKSMLSDKDALVRGEAKRLSEPKK